MFSFARLPAELLVGILIGLDRKSQRSLRCVAKVFYESVTDVLFKRVFFDFDAGGIDNLVAISKHPHLAKRVRTIVFKRRNSIKRFDDFQRWRCATVYEHTLSNDIEPTDEEIERIEWIEGVMSQSEWKMLTETEQRELFDDYSNDYAEINRRTSQLATATSLNIYNHGATRNAEADQTIRCFSQAVNRFSSVKELLHVPSYCLDGWGERWRNVQFHRDGLILQTNDEDDMEKDVLQLFIAIREVMVLDTMRHVKLCTRGHAFWSATHLRRLLDWDADVALMWLQRDHLAMGIEDWMERIGGPVAACRYMEAATRCITAMESGFSRLQALDLYVDTREVDRADELVAISETVSRVLQRGKRLEKLKLAICESSWDLDMHTRPYHNGSSLGTPGPEEIEKLALASISLFRPLVECKSLKGLVTLELTANTTEYDLCALLSRLHSLRHLVMEYIMLLPGMGTWESVLRNIAEEVSLQSIELLNLEDVLEGSPRLLFQPQAPSWINTATGQNDYVGYENAIVDFVLRRSRTLPPLCARDYLSPQDQPID